MPPLPVQIWRVLGMLRRISRRIVGPASADPKFIKQKVAELRCKDSPIKVGFLVCSPAKWSLNSLFVALQKDPNFTPVFYPTISDAAMRLSKTERANDFAKTVSFFERIGTIGTCIYEPVNDTLKSAKAVDADVVFIQQPWGMQDMPRQLHHHALPAYVHYGYPVIKNETMQYGLPHFHPFLWTHFVPDETQATAMRTDGKPQAGILMVTGHPKLDIYLSATPSRDLPVWPNAQDAARRRVIFAPHHSFSESSLNMATFEWSGPAVLKLALQHPYIDFVLKPHPNFRYEIERAGESLTQMYAQFSAQWHEASNTSVAADGNYFDLFRTSDLMITDSGSFLAEYLPTQCPLIRLTKEGAADLNDSGKALSQAFYSAPNAEVLNELFEQLFKHEDDPLKDARLAAGKTLLPDQRSSAERVMDHLRATLVR